MEKLLTEILAKLSSIEKRVKNIENQLQILTEDDEYVEEEGQPVFDDALPDAIKLLRKQEAITVAYLQKNLKLGYARAVRIIDILKQFEMVTVTDSGDSFKVHTDKVEEFLKKDSEETRWN